MADNEIRQRKKKKKEISGEDHHEKRSKTAELTNKGINPLLILLLVCVVCTWGIAATLVFNLVDYRGIIDKGKNVDVCEEDIKLAIGALYPFQYEIIRHPIKAVGQFLINVDDYITEALSPKKDPYTLVDRRKTVPPSHPAQYVKKKVGWAKNLKSLPTKEEPTPTRAPETLQSSHFKAVVKENRFFRVYRRTPKYPKLPVISDTVEASEVENNSIGNIIDAKDS